MPLNKLKRMLVPQDDIFFKLMQKQADTADEASHALHDLFKNYRDVGEKSKKIKDLEHQGDQLMRDIYMALNKTFIVPIDHSDISTLASALDDVLDLIDHVAAFMVIYEIKAPSNDMKELVDVLVEQADELTKAVALIDSPKTYGKVIIHCTKIKQLENKADELYRQAIGALFKKNDAMEALKQKEILDCLESATDKIDKAAQYMSDIVMKHS
ncbi:MAG: DUF47 family protein [Candidatus Micrarchaeota archaeon]